MTRWFRFYDEALDDHKVQSLSGDDFKAWVNLLCLASRNGGRIPTVEGVAFALRMNIIAAGSLLDRLLIAGLIDRVKGGPNGSGIAPHGWEKRQYKSDTSTERVKRFRNVSETANETAPDTDTDTDTEVRKEPIGSKRKLTPEDIKTAMKAKRGARLPALWEPTEAHKTLANTEGLNHDELKREAAKFRDYWLGATGPNATKLDWDAAFRNWIRKAAEQFRRPGGNAPGGRGGSAPDLLGAYQRAASRFGD